MNGITMDQTNGSDKMCAKSLEELKEETIRLIRKLSEDDCEVIYNKLRERGIL